MKDDHITYWSKAEVKTTLHHARLILQQASKMEDMLAVMRHDEVAAAEDGVDDSDDEDDRMRSQAALPATAQPKRQAASPAKAKQSATTPPQRQAASPKVKGEIVTPMKSKAAAKHSPEKGVPKLAAKKLSPKAKKLTAMKRQTK
jgi:hypothetical protein